MSIRRPVQLRWFQSIILLPVLIFFSGCSEQPQGYIFEPQQRDYVNATYQVAEFLGTLYGHTDAAVSFMSQAAQTHDYRAILPQGWRDLTAYDTTGRPRGAQFLFLHNYLDQKYYQMLLDRDPTPGAVRTPSNIEYNYLEIGAGQNPITSSFYGNIAEVRRIKVTYADNLRNPDYVEGWYSLRKALPYTYYIQIEVPGQGSGTFGQRFYYNATWSARIERFSTALNDQRSRIVIDGTLPMLDRQGGYQEPHLSAEFNINRDGSGSGEVWLHGEPASRVRLEGRTFGFQGTFTLFSEDHKGRYRL
ncbi:MAG: hypothetical protein FJY67_08720 [Calditrichaeota bacterium]|nr:hypothetical protein [Calditrichota bacterium]